jgi:hypothetical protein
MFHKNDTWSGDQGWRMDILARGCPRPGRGGPRGGLAAAASVAVLTKPRGGRGGRAEV